MKFHPVFHLPACTATALLLSSCVVKDGSLDFTWWKDAAAPVMEDDVVIDTGAGQHYQSKPAPAQVPAASIPRETPPTAAPASHVATQQQPSVAPPTETPAVHMVQRGDTLSALARRYGTTVRALVAANGMASADIPLKVNQMLIIPKAGSTYTPAPGTYVVQPGDTLYGIARRYGVPAATLMQVNGLTPATADTIKVGATLRIPSAR